MPQFVLIAEQEQLFAATLQVILDEIALGSATAKIMLFCTTARATSIMAELLSLALARIPSAKGIEMLEIHSRKSQSARTKASDAFRAATRAILCSSDVTARGMDFPFVSPLLLLLLTILIHL